MTATLKWSVGICVLVTVIFCASFVAFYSRWKGRDQPQTFPSTQFPATLEGREFPTGRFTNLSGDALDNQQLRSGKVVLVFVAPDCDQCNLESQFLRTLVNSRRDVKFYGIIPIGDKTSALTAAAEPNKYPFAVYYDDDLVYRRGSKAIAVPVKVFLENGVVRRTWLGATRDESEQRAFAKWLEDLK